jgi:hypothetical protein
LTVVKPPRAFAAQILISGKSDSPPPASPSRRVLPKETSMASTIRTPVPVSLDARCYRLTAMGRACVDVVQTEGQTVGSLSRYLHDVLVLCGSGIWFEQLQQCMPPRSLEESLRTLLALGLIETVQRSEAPARPATQRRRRSTIVMTARG